MSIKVSLDVCRAIVTDAESCKRMENTMVVASHIATDLAVTELLSTEITGIRG